MWLLRWDHAKQWSLWLVCRDITFWNPEPLCQTPTPTKLPHWEKARVTCKSHMHLLWEWPLLSQAFPGHYQHRCQTGESRCWQKILRPSCEVTSTVHVSPVEATDIRSRIHELNRGFFDATMFLDDFLCGKRNWVDFPLLISPLHCDEALLH